MNFDVPRLCWARPAMALCRSCQTGQEKILRCQQILAACVNVIPAGIVQQEPGLTVALDAMRDTLQELCSSAAGVDSRATQAKLLQPAVAQLTTVLMLASQRDSSDRSASGQAYMHPADLQLAGSEVALLALEMRCVMAKQSIQPNTQVMLAAHDIKSLTGGRLGGLQQISASYICNSYIKCVVQAVILMQYWTCC